MFSFSCISTTNCSRLGMYSLLLLQNQWVTLQLRNSPSLLAQTSCLEHTKLIHHSWPNARIFISESKETDFLAISSTTLTTSIEIALALVCRLSSWEHVYCHLGNFVFIYFFSEHLQCVINIKWVNTELKSIVSGKKLRLNIYTK